MPWCRSRHASGQAPHAHLDPCCWPPFFRARRLVVSPNPGAAQKRHPALTPPLLGQEQQPLPHAQVGPADEGLSRSRPGTKLSRDGAPLGPVLMPPDNGRNRAPQILGRGLALGAGSCPWGGVLPLGRHVSISGSSFIQCASASIAPPHPGGPKCYPGAEVQGRTGSRGAPVVLGRSRTLGMRLAATGES